MPLEETNSGGDDWSEQWARGAAMAEALEEVEAETAPEEVALEEVAPEPVADEEDAAPEVDGVDFEKFRKQAEKLGFLVEKGDIKKVTLEERKAFRGKMHAERSKWASEIESQRQELQEQGERLHERYKKYADIESAVEADNMDAVAKALGYKDYEALARHQVNKRISPEYREIQALKAREAAREAEAAERAAQEDQARQEEARSAAEQEYIEDTSLYLTETPYAAWAGDPDFVNAVVTFQRQHYDGHETISVEQAASLALQGAQAMYQKLNSYFAGQPDSGASAGTPTRGASAGKQGRRPSRTISQQETAEASGKDVNSQMSDDEWVAKWAPRMSALR